MKMFRFEKPFDFKPSQAVTIHFSAGSVRRIPEAQVEAASTAGVGQVDETATEEVIVDDTTQLSTVIRADPPYVPQARPAMTEKPVKGKSQ